MPAGIEDGQTVRMPVGTKEVYITFKVEKSDYFTRKGADVHTDATISLAQVLLNRKTGLIFFPRISEFFCDLSSELRSIY